MKKFILVLNEQIVSRYEKEESVIFGGPWCDGVSYEVPERVDLLRAQISFDEEGGYLISEAPLTEEEEFQKEVAESESYLQDIQKGQGAIAYFRLLNDKKGLTAEQKLELVSDPDIQHILQMLTLGKLPEAISMIDAIDADGVMITESDKQKLIKFLGE